MSSAPCGVQPPPPTIASGRSDAVSNSRMRARACGAGPDAARTTGAASGASVASTSMSSGSASTTGPGRPPRAVSKARATSSGMRSARSISNTHLARRPNICS